MSSDHPTISQLNAAGAPDFVTADAQGLLDKAKAHFEAHTGRTLSPSQVEMYLLETIAYMLSVRGAEEQLALENGFVAYAGIDGLEWHGVERNMPRLEAASATTVLRFSTETPAVNRIRIPQGTRVSDNGAQVQFLTLEAAYIETDQTQVDIKSEATETGIFANGFPIGSIAAIVDPVPGIFAATNLTATGAGAELEDIARYRERLPLAFEGIGDGLSRERYVSDVFSWNVRCIAVEVLRPQPGYVDLWPLMDTGAPNAEERASLLAVFEGSNTHQGDFIQVQTPSAHDFEFTLALTVTDPDAAPIAQAEVQTVLDDWSQELGGYIAPSELTRVAKGIAGVVEADIPDLVLTSVAETGWRNGSILNVTVQVV
jgi:phage-related baseplate assembly protein